MGRGIRAVRAAALLLIAGGVSSVASAYIDERWIFIAALAVIGAFDGIVIGVIATIVAVIADEVIVHSAFTFTPNRDTLLLAAGIAAVIVGRVVRGAVSRPRVGALESALDTARATSESLAARVEELENAIDVADAEFDRLKKKRPRSARSSQRSG